jgi:uncharacterized protein YijF (DUF1287 family)
MRESDRPSVRRRHIIILMIAAIICVVALVTCVHVLRSSDQSAHSSVSTTSTARGSSSQHPYSGSIPQVHSRFDHNRNGVDDQIDILNGARAYAATKPKYASEYYQGGYPTDGKGVCTDLVAAAFKHAGLNLRDLVDQDIRRDPSAYGISQPDPNIDYRRVRNLIVFFRHWATQGNATSLTTNIHDVKDWQGGDVVIFRNHIGIVSDRRDAQGITYVIHHISASQRNFEEDILPHRSDIVGHYRVR